MCRFVIIIREKKQYNAREGELWQIKIRKQT